MQHTDMENFSESAKNQVIKNNKTNLLSIFSSKTLLDFYFIYRNT